ncbi:MAG TPA: phosphatase PAP2 family protein [Vicinamibacterales bacterium]|nr:phosphatase PAP2 family protein [Vicinamibacterales bacterium]
MSYLRLLRARIALLLFASTSLWFFWFPAIDLRVSRLFFHAGGFQLATAWWAKALHASVGYVIGLSMVLVGGVYLRNRLARRNLPGVDLRVVGYLLAVLILGAGIIVNVALKDNFGRARPRNAVPFGGGQEFTPAFVVSDQCTTNCSFSSGDGAGAFFTLALARALGRWRALLGAVAYGCLVSFARIAAGAHFLSDIVVSFFVMWLTADALHFYMLLRRRAPRRRAVSAGRLPQYPGGGTAPAPPTAPAPAPLS